MTPGCVAPVREPSGHSPPLQQHMLNPCAKNTSRDPACECTINLTSCLHVPSTALGGPVCSCCHGGRVGRSNLLLVPFVDNAGGSALRLLALGHCHAVSCGRAALPLVSCSTEKRPPGSLRVSVSSTATA
eukprot:1159260-Pelagomonas_calceolata.AAC.1